MIEADEEYFNVVKNPAHGYGKNLNPCIDCKIFILKKAKEYMLKNGASFFLQTAIKKFYPDFVCKLTDGRILVVEYKGADRWKNAESDRLVGELWEELSGGACAFVMVKEKRWEWIQTKLQIL